MRRALGIGVGERWGWERLPGEGSHALKVQLSEVVVNAVLTANEAYTRTLGMNDEE